jgi:hypothetical protein
VLRQFQVQQGFFELLGTQFVTHNSKKEKIHEVWQNGRENKGELKLIYDVKMKMDFEAGDKGQFEIRDIEIRRVSKK